MPRSLLILAGAVLALLAFHDRPQAHEWFPLRCCSDKDCYEISASEIEPRASGYYIRESGETFPYQKIEQPPDLPSTKGKSFRCSVNGNRKAGTICLFVEPPGA